MCYRARVAIIAILPFLGACRGESTQQVAMCAPPVGEATLAVPGGNIWYKVSGTGSGLPVVLLHGGPGFSSYYLKPLEDLGDDRLVIRYDQLGGGRSDMITDTAMFTIAHFVNELDSLRSHLGCTEWHVFGHSWGTILALEYYRAHPDHVASLTFGSAVFDIPAYEARAKELVATLSLRTQQVHRIPRPKGQSPGPGSGNLLQS